MTVKAIETAPGISNNDMICDFIVIFFFFHSILGS